MSLLPLLSTRIAAETDVVQARQRARDIAAVLTFDIVSQTRIATAVSEIARNALVYAQGGRVDFAIEGVSAPQLLAIRISDAGRGIANLDDILGGRYRSPTGMGRGLIGTQRLVDRFDIVTGPAGTTVALHQLLPRDVPVFDRAAAERLVQELLRQRPMGAVAEVQRQNHELLETLEQLRARQEDLEHVNRELEDTNRGVVALYAELDERADHLRRADEVKTRFLSNMTHEFRTPVNSILSLTRLLAERLDIDPGEQNEVYYIRKSAQQLAEIVDDLLDLAKVEAGKVDLRPAVFEIDSLFGALRGMLRPLLVNASLALVFEEPQGVPPIRTDESKLSQVLRNFISNAIKYTERGEVRVSAHLLPDGRAVKFSVADTGIGIPAGDLGRIFEEFVQIENPLQRRVKGTGLGLPLSKRLAELLGGEVQVESALGQGSTFSVVLPLEFRETVVHPEILPDRIPVLVVEDSDVDRLLYERMLARSRYQIISAATESEVHSLLRNFTPAAIVLDLDLQGRDCWQLLARLKSMPSTAHVPVVIISASHDERKGLALGAAEYATKPVPPGWLRTTLDRLLSGEAIRVLAIDDEETARFIVRSLLDDGRFLVDEAASAHDGLERARQQTPDVILLDLNLAAGSGFSVRQALRADPRTASIPVIVLTAHTQGPELAHALGGDTPILSKGELTREQLTGAIERVYRVAGIES